jgi:hypothetical protein
LAGGKGCDQVGKGKIPNSKIQTPEKLQIPNSNGDCFGMFAVWRDISADDGARGQMAALKALRLTRGCFRSLFFLASGFDLFANPEPEQWESADGHSNRNNGEPPKIQVNVRHGQKSVPAGQQK